MREEGGKVKRTFFDAEVELERSVGLIAGHEGDILELTLVVCDLYTLSLLSQGGAPHNSCRM